MERDKNRCDLAKRGKTTALQVICADSRQKRLKTVSYGTKSGAKPTLNCSIPVIGSWTSNSWSADAENLKSTHFFLLGGGKQSNTALNISMIHGTYCSGKACGTGPNPAKFKLDRAAVAKLVQNRVQLASNTPPNHPTK